MWLKNKKKMFNSVAQCMHNSSHVNSILPWYAGFSCDYRTIHFLLRYYLYWDLNNYQCS